MSKSPEWGLYIDDYLKPTYEWCKRKLPECPKCCLDKVSTPFFHWARERELLERE